MIVVADSSPLIALSRIGRLNLLRQLFGRLLVPQAVWREVALADPSRAGVRELLQADWVEQCHVVDVALVQLLRLGLGR